MLSCVDVYIAEQCGVTVNVKATGRYFSVVLFVMMYNVESVNDKAIMRHFRLWVRLVFNFFPKWNIEQKKFFYIFMWWRQPDRQLG